MTPLDNVYIVAKNLNSLRERVVFVGGSITGLLIPNAAASSIRHTADVDVIVEVMTRHDYYEDLSSSLRQCGFVEDASEDAPLCRWKINGVLVDVMPTSRDILGFSNRWYRPALTAPLVVELDDLHIRVISAPYFLATKLEAFHDRGKDDFQSSHDMEDFIAIINDRPIIVSEVHHADEEVRDYLREQVCKLLKESRFMESIPGHLDGDMASQQRITIVLDRLRQIIT